MSFFIENKKIFETISITSQMKCLYFEISTIEQNHSSSLKKKKKHFCTAFNEEMSLNITYTSNIYIVERFAVRVIFNRRSRMEFSQQNSNETSYFPPL